MMIKLTLFISIIISSILFLSPDKAVKEIEPVVQDIIDELDPNTYEKFKVRVLREDYANRIAQYSAEDIYCLAANVYHEARNDMIVGQFAVADVVLNRVEDKRFPNTICEVVYDGPVVETWATRKTKDPNDAVFIPVRNKCQFSWYCDGMDDDIREDVAWRQAQAVAHMIIGNQSMRGITEGSTHYHATYVNPWWAKSKYEIGRIGKHKFYRWL
jgi:spore germination cell wall hydrolase CwlJ-like protein